MQNQGSIGPATVAELLQTMQQERATGTLSLESDGQKCALHFLFGHLFHAVGGGAEGEPAVLSVLAWSQGSYNFNPRAKLPPEETINSSTEDLLSQWQSGSGDGSTAVALPATGRATPAAEAEGAGDWLSAVPAGGEGREEEEMNDIQPFQAPAPRSQPTPPPPAWPAAREATPAATPAAVRTAAPVVGRTQPRPAPPQPAPKPVAGATRAQLSVLVPMPSGPSLHSGLKASFLNFPMLLKTLSQDGFSGYVSISGERDNRGRGHILFRDGAVIQAQQRADGSYRRGKTALQEVVRTVGLGEGLIDAVELPGELVASVAPLIVATTTFINLPARIVDFDALLEYIEDQHVSGGILVSHADQVAVALLAEGTVKGSYGTSAPELTDGPQVASSACTEREARIDVVAAPSQALVPLDLAEIG